LDFKKDPHVKLSMRILIFEETWVGVKRDSGWRHGRLQNTVLGLQHIRICTRSVRTIVV
jgi:hypothetical protein